MIGEWGVVNMTKHMNELNFQEVVDLRQEIVLDSLFLRDYENTLGVDHREVIGFFDGYIEYLDELCKEQGDPDLNWTDFDCTENLWSWYNIYQ